MLNVGRLYEADIRHIALMNTDHLFANFKTCMWRNILTQNSNFSLLYEFFCWGGVKNKGNQK